MKKLLLSFYVLLLVVLFTSINATAQDQEKIGYRIKDAAKTIVVRKAPDLITLGDPMILSTSVYFQINSETSISIKDKKYILITIPGKAIDNNNSSVDNKNSIAASSSSNTAIMNTIGQEDFGLSFWMPSEYIDNEKINDNFNVEYAYSRVSVSVLVVPFKFRLSSNGPEGQAFTTEATIGTCIGFNLIKNTKFKYGLTLSIGGGITTFSRNIADKVDPTKTVQQNITGFSIVPALIFNSGDVQMGLVVGSDYAAVDPKWTYSGKPWISFSVGYSFLNLFKGKNN